ncbi:unnamed protein product [Closterium sp. Naga37s-1]|nr:unnamed protein product [Closterium sp. Naga37s-1]
MFRNTFQSGFLSILYSLGYVHCTPSPAPSPPLLSVSTITPYACSPTSPILPPPLLPPPSPSRLPSVPPVSLVFTKPLQLWAKEEGEGTVKRVTDADIQSAAIELLSPNIRTTLIACPPDPSAALGIKLPFLVLVLKPLDRYFSFEVTVLDDKNVKRRFRASNYQSTTRVRPFICTMPLRLEAGWNSLLFNLADFTRRAYGTGYVETQRVHVHASCRLRRIYFCDRVYSDDELPPEFKLFVPSKVRVVWCACELR